MSQPRRILVTGAGGFVGANLVRALRRKGAELIATVHRDHHRLTNITDVTIVETDLRDDYSVRSLLFDLRPEVIINAASRGVKPNETDLDELYAANVTGAWHLHIRAAECRCRHFIQLGSYFEYGNADGPVAEDAPSRPMTPYAATKAAATLLLRERADHGTMSTTIMRLFDLWGPMEESHRFVPSLIRACQQGTPFPMSGGEQLKDYSFIGDTASWIAELSLRPERLPWPLINIASGTPRTLRDFALEIAQNLGRPDILHFGALPYRPNEPFATTADTTRLDSLLPLRENTSLREALFLVRAGVSTVGRRKLLAHSS